jgi:hypothetical protein
MVATHQSDLTIYNLLNSIDDNIINIELLLIVVSQDCSISYIPENELFSIIYLNEKKMGLSKARNIALDYLKNKNISSDYIMFPDDDSSFDKFFFINYTQVVDLENNFVTPIYNVNSKDLYIGKKGINKKQIKINDFKLIGSPNQIVLFEKYKENIYFDEELGVGSKYGSSEDLDFFIRLNKKGANFVYSDNIYSYHPKKTDFYQNKKLKDVILRFKNYSNGFALIIFRYKLYGFIFPFLTRSFAGFLFFLFKFNFKLSLAYLLQFFFRIQILFHFKNNGIRKTF